jgi:poly(A) polymerase
VSQQEKAFYIIQRLRETGHEAYLAGGCVRDQLLGRLPKDYDIATAATSQSVQAAFPDTVPIGSKFGSVVVVIDGDPFEVTTFRFDGPYSDGRHPMRVRYGTLEEDVRRRDFTINAMMYDPVNDRVIDLVNGRKDLQLGLIRAIGDPHERFAEDRLRMVRAVRLACGLGFAIDQPTFNAIREHAASVTQIAWERIGTEITRTLTEGVARRGVELLNETGLLEVILPEVAAMRGCEQTPDHHPEGDVFIHTLTLLQHMVDPTETLAYGCLLHDVAKPPCRQPVGSRVTFYGHPELGAGMATEILQRLKRSRAVTEQVAWLVRHHLRYTQAPKMRLSTLKRFLRDDSIGELLELCRIDALSSNGDLSYYEFCQRKLVELGEEEVRPQPLLRGRDLIRLGYTPGRSFSEMLEAVEEAQLEGELLTREHAVGWVQGRYPLDDNGGNDKP